MKKPITLFIAYFLLLSVCVSQERAAETETYEEAPELDIEALLRRRITETALNYLETPYKYAGLSPEGFDCSGFIWFVYHEAAGIELPRSAAGMWKQGKPVTEAREGDILVFTTIRPGPSHAGIVLENSPDGISFIHAASSGPQLGVIVSRLAESYYKTRYLGARTFLRRPN
jgi:cell wall-associated NlpC family hydrolase